MTPYIILILAVDAAVLIGMTVHGAGKGFAEAFSKGISFIAAVVVVVLLSSMVHGYRNGELSNLVIGGLLLVILGTVYKLVHVVLTSIRFLAELPVLKGIDKLLGAVMGFLEGFAILYITEYLLRLYLLR